MRRTAYSIVVAGLCGLVWLVARAAEADSIALLLGVFGAGAIQISAFWRLAARLSAGQDATRAWVGGMAARFAAFALMAGLAFVIEVVPREAATGFAFTLIALVLLEAVWLAVATSRTRPVEG
ncbi:MAG: hypothetical protein ACE5FP_11385 [Gemmatimonadota bacterium]